MKKYVVEKTWIEEEGTRPFSDLYEKVYLASEADARIAEMRQAFETSSTDEERKLRARIAELEKSHARYEKLRRLDPRQFHSLWMQNIATGEKFDDLVDRLSS